jgi:hypothetical protein
VKQDIEAGYRSRLQKQATETGYRNRYRNRLQKQDVEAGY